MSKKEMENLDEQVLQIANSAGEARCAEEIQQAEQEAENCEKDRCERVSEERKRKMEQEIERQKMKLLLAMLAKLAACLTAAGVFLAMVLNPKFWVPVVGCIGIMTFVVMGAIGVDRYCRRCR